MSAAQLRALWQATFGEPHPVGVHHGFLLRALAYHFQEKAYRGLSAVLRRRLLAYAEEVQEKGSIASLEKLKIKPGTRLVREWHGETHVVTAREADFEAVHTGMRRIDQPAKNVVRSSSQRLPLLFRPVSPNAVLLKSTSQIRHRKDRRTF